MSSKFILSVICSVFAVSYAVTSQIPQDGPTTTGGVGWPSPRFVAAGGESASCITDKLTGLVWVRDLNTVPVPDAAAGSKASFANAKAAIVDINKSGLCGYKDWRLPNINELKSLLNTQESDNAQWLNAGAGSYCQKGCFKNVQSSVYWTSTPYAANANLTWTVSFYRAPITPYSTDVYSYYVWPVRGGK